MHSMPRKPFSSGHKYFSSVENSQTLGGGKTVFAGHEGSIFVSVECVIEL